MACAVENVQSPLKRFKKIPIYVFEEHHRALFHIYSAIGGKKLPVEGTTLLHFDAHPDMLISAKLKGEIARAGWPLIPHLEIENWIVPAAAAGHISRVVWIRPPWAKQFSDGDRVIRVGDHPETGLLRVDSTEPYYLSDALYSSRLINERTFTFTVAELKVTEEINSLVKLSEDLNICEPYVLDIDLDFFSTDNPFLSIYGNIGLYDLLEPIFRFEIPKTDNKEEIEKATESRERQLLELETLFNHLDNYNSLETYDGEKSHLFYKVSEVVAAVKTESERSGESPDWWVIYAAGCTRDQGGLPRHISTTGEIIKFIRQSLKRLLNCFPPPVLITIARSSDDGYCPADRVEFIQSTVLQTLKELYDTAEPTFKY
ncbi:UPF0489 protein C5orf22 homolog [Epargyreus clarus]|uniref:UPF0489 protein C5orf22 homolog n=1 Tax=Epargyreus clarus TaxID=520877 RepID=UPI003C2D3D6B